MRRTLRTALVLLALVALAVPLAAITWGQKDPGSLYPEVGAIVVVPKEGPPFLFCSGTLVDPRVFLTAGHCTAALEAYADLIEHIYVSFDAEPLGASAEWHDVAAIETQPLYRDLKPASDPHDLGVLVLEEAVAGIAPATLPDEGLLDALRAGGALGHGTHGAKFTVAGYGASITFPPPRTYNDDVRQYGYSEFRALLPAWLRLSQQGRTGDEGTCYGDSGGPTFWEPEGGPRVLVATTSWGDTNCVTSEFQYRVDLPASLEFIYGVIDSLAQ